MPRSSDVVVVGAGAFGAWTAWHLHRAGHTVALVDAFGAGHSRASSGGESRIIRMGYGDRTLYSRWALESLPQWKDLLSDAGRPDLFRETGVLWLGHDDDPHVDVTARTLDRLRVVTESLGPADLRSRFPALDFTGITRGILEPGSESCWPVARSRWWRNRRPAAASTSVGGGRATLARLAQRSPESERRHTPVGRVLRLRLRSLAAEAVSPTCSLRCCARHARRSSSSGLPPGIAASRRRPLPAWIDFRAGAYGLPDIEGRGAKVGLTALGPIFDPDRGDRTPSATGLETARRFAALRLPGLRDAPVLEARVCQYTNTPSGDLLLDRHPDHDNVWLAGGGSGHGFKLGPAVGAYMASRVTGPAAAEELVGLPAKRPEQDRPFSEAQPGPTIRPGEHTALYLHLRSVL